MSTELARLVPPNQGHRYNTENAMERAQINITDNNTDARSCMENWFKSLVFGGFDGLIASLVLTSAAAGGDIDRQVTIALGFTYILTNSLYLGVSEYLSAKAQREFLSAEKRRATWEFKHYKDTEISHLITKYEERGMSRKDAEVVVFKMAQYESFFVSQMVTEEIGLSVPTRDEDVTLIADSFLMFLAFIVFGAVPFVVLAIGQQAESVRHDTLFLILAIVCNILLFVLGVTKSSFSGTHWFYCGAEGLVLGVVCTVVAHFVGEGLAAALI